MDKQLATTPPGNAVSKALIRHCWQLEYEDLPEPAVRQAKRCLLDYLGAAFGGSGTETAKKVRAFLSKFDVGEHVAAIGHGRKTDALRAALANGITSHVLEMDDGERRSTVHPASAVMSAVLPLAEQRRIAGKRAIAAIVAGYEAAIRLGRAVQPSHRACGFHSTATCGTFGAAVAAAKVLELGERETSAAFALAGTSASGLLEFLSGGGEMKQFHPGKAAMCGLVAAHLAQCGFAAPEDILEGDRGFFRSMSEDFHPAECLEHLGEKWAILAVYFKPFAACRHCHAPIEGAIRIRERRRIALDQIAKISVSTYKQAVDGHAENRPQSSTAAKMSLPYCVAVALKTGWAGTEEFEPACFRDPEVLRLSGMVEVCEDEALTKLVPGKRSAIVVLTLKDGRSFREHVEVPKGEPENPLSDDEIEQKFMSLASSSRTPECLKEIRAVVENMEDRLDELFPLLL